VKELQYVQKKSLSKSPATIVSKTPLISILNQKPLE
jgi:hypothetical protein